MGKKRMLIVEDDPSLGKMLQKALYEHDIDVVVCADAETGLKAFRSRKIDLCILDVVLPMRSGLHLAREIKAIQPKVPLLFLTARGLKSDMLAGYEAGGDDYLVKPFDVDVLKAKINAIFQRKSNVGADGDTQQSDFWIDPIRRLLHTPETRVELSKTECQMMAIFLRYFGKPVARDIVMQQVWGYSDSFVSNSLDVHMNRLRKRLKKCTKLKLETLRGHGYVLSATN